MAINLSKVNISLQQFQEISRGEYNAGEVRLASETKLAKMNNHVHRIGKNTETISHAEVIAIKEAFVKALSQNGIDGEAINRIRKDLGLAPDGDAYRTLSQRSIKPLTRQQIREILDLHSGTINSQPLGNSARIDTSSVIYGPNGMSEEAKAKRDAVNAQLSDGHRKVFVNSEIRNFQRVVAGSGEYCDSQTRQSMCKIATGLLDDILAACHGHPRADVPVTATFRLSSGQVISLPTDKNEQQFVSHLEDMILLERTDYGRELHVLLGHDSVDHVAYETGDRLVEMGRNPPQERFKLPKQFRRNCGIMHGVAFLVGV